MINFFRKVGRKFNNALRGLWIIIREENSLWVHLFLSAIVIILGILFHLSLMSWALITICIGLVIGFEIFNTAIEYLVDIVSFEYDIKAKKIKDVAAMATLFISIIAVVIGLLVFIPEIIEFVEGSI